MSAYNNWTKKFSAAELDGMFGDIQDKKYICAMDLELTCWDDKSTQFSTKQEVIEIGVVVLDANRLIVENQISRTVRPMYNPELSDYCKNLTGITQDEIDGSKNLLVETRNMFADGLPDPKDFVWACWGHDPVWLQNEMIDKSYTNDVDRTLYYDQRWINVSLCAGGGGLKRGCKTYNVEYEQPAHRALADAISVSRIVKAMGLKPMDYQISNSRTFRQKLDGDRREQARKLAKRTNGGLNEEAALGLLKQCYWDFNRANNMYKWMKKYFNLGENK